MKDVISSNPIGYFEVLNSLFQSNQENNFFTFFQKFSQEEEKINKEIFEDLSKGLFWDKSWLEEFKQIIEKFKLKTNHSDKVIKTLVEFINKEKYNKEVEFDKEGSDETELIDTEIIPNILKNAKNYRDFLEDIYLSILEIKNTLEEKDFITFSSDKKKTFVQKLLDRKDDYTGNSIIYLFQIWELELNTIIDNREHIGLRENLNKLRSLQRKINEANCFYQKALKELVNFLVWKNEIENNFSDELAEQIDIKIKEIIKHKEEPYFDFKSIYLFHKKADLLEDSSLEKENAKKKLKQLFSPIFSFLKDEKNDESLGWEHQICLGRYLKDFSGYSKEANNVISQIVDFIEQDIGNFYDDEIFKEKNKVYVKNFHLSFLIQAYEDITDDTQDLEKKIEKDNDFLEGKEVYFRLFKLGYYFYLKAQKNIENDDNSIYKESLKKSEKYLSKARKLYLEKGRFTYPCYASFNFAKKYGIFSLSTFIPHTLDGDLHRIDEVFNKILILETKKEFLITQKYTKNLQEELKKQFSEQLREEQKNSSKRTVEILAIFSAIILFTIGNIQLYSNIESLKAAVVFTLFFSAALCLFGFLIYAIVRLENTKTTPKVIFGGIVFILLITIIYLFFGKDSELDNKNKKHTIEFNLETF